MSLATDSEISIVYAAMGMVQSKFDIQESISWFFKRSLSLSYNSSYSIFFLNYLIMYFQLSVKERLHSIAVCAMFDWSRQK